MANRKTAAELSRIAAISMWAKSNNHSDGNCGQLDEVCQVATPVDAVLVCGFVGFDDTGTNIRPNLGARLVAFDGVSVEVGKWTFDSIRKAIQARDRPLTLSFRNDYLTTEQRAILTKAIKDVGGVVPAYFRPSSILVGTELHQQHHRQSLDDPSIHSALSHESDLFVNDGSNSRDRRIQRPPQHSSRVRHQDHDDLTSISASSNSTGRPRSVSNKSIPRSFSGAKSVASGGNFRSFSEAGSSTTSVLSAVAPLMSNLLYRGDCGPGGSSREPFTPEYLRREPESVEDTPQHQDFESELL